MAFNVRLAGRVEPPDGSVQAAPAAERLWFYRTAGAVAVARLRAQLLRAIGAQGSKMPPRKRPRPDGANGPVLSPHRAESRTLRLLAFRAWQDGLTLFWHGGVSKTQKLPWGSILEAHAAGNVRGAPARDVRLSEASVRAIAREMAVRWRSRQASKRKPPRPKPPPTPAAPTQRPRFVPEPGLRGYVTVRVSVARFDRGFRKDEGYYVGPGGKGGIPGRYEGFVQFLQTGKPVEQPKATVDPDGTVSFLNGRHRWAVLRDRGLKVVPVSVPRDQAARARRLYGAGSPGRRRQAQTQPRPDLMVKPPTPPEPAPAPPPTKPAGRVRRFWEGLKTVVKKLFRRG